MIPEGLEICIEEPTSPRSSEIVLIQLAVHPLSNDVFEPFRPFRHVLLVDELTLELVSEEIADVVHDGDVVS